MPTPTGIAAANAQTTDEAWLMLAEITHPGLSPPIRVVRNKVDVVHQGNNYVRFPFEVKLPDDDAAKRAVGQLEIDDIGEFDDPVTGQKKTIGDIVKSIPVGQNPIVILTLVLGSNPNLIEMGPMQFTLRNVRGNGLTIKGDLLLDDLVNEPFPCDSMPA